MKTNKIHLTKTFVISFVLMTMCCLLFLFSGNSKALQIQNHNFFEDIDFEEYREIIAQMAETEEYPHFLEANSQRYNEYQSRNPEMSFDLVIAHVNAYIDKEPYEDILQVSDPYSTTVLVNKIFSLPSDWAPDDLTDIGGGHMMREEAAEHFNLMREAMRDDGLNLVIVITQRTYRSQRNHYNNAVAELGRASADAGFARPGHSEHQTGLAVDVLHRAHDGGLMMRQGFDDSRQYTWLIENAHNYGFILRYPQGYRNLSGFIFEPWHWRYVGIPVATAMHNEEIALFEEFYGRYLAQDVIDKANDWLIDQQAAEAARIAAAEQAAAEEAAEAARIAEEEAVEAARIAAEHEAAQQAAAEEEARIAAQQEALRLAEETAAAELAARIREATTANRHLLELFAVIIISALYTIYLIKKR